MTRLTALIIAGISACLATAAGIYTISRFERQSRSWSSYFVGFAAGVILAVSFLHLIPKAFSMYGDAGPFFLMGFLGLYVMEQLLGDEEKHHDTGHQQVIGFLALVGIGFHSFIDGIIYTITFTIDMLTGILSSIGMVLHEFPEGIIMFTLLKEGGYSQRKSMIYAFCAVGLTTPLGAVTAYPFFKHLSLPILGRLLAISAGFLIYLGAVHLLPRILKEKSKGAFASFFSGVLLAICLHLIKHV